MMDSGDGTKTPPKCSSVSSFGESFRWRERAGGSIFNGSHSDLALPFSLWEVISWQQARVQQAQGE